MNQIHVTANEAGRNAVLQDRLLELFDVFIDALENGADKDELVDAIKWLKKYLIRNMKTRPIIGD